MASRRALRSGRACIRIGHHLVRHRIGMHVLEWQGTTYRSGRCSRCGHMVEVRIFGTPIQRCTRYPLREHWYRRGGILYIRLYQKIAPSSRSHRALFPSGDPT